MKIPRSRGRLYQKVSLFGLAFVLSLSSLGVVVPKLFLHTAHALPAPSSAVVYDALPAVSPMTNYPSLGYEATSTSEFGDYIHLGGTNRVLNTVTVTLSDWAKYADYASNPTYAGNDQDWSLPITVNVYSNHLTNGVPDQKLATVTQTVSVPWRPASDPSCGSTSNGNGWKENGSCVNLSGIASNATFDLSSLNVTLPNDIIIGIAYNTQNYGAAPTGVAGPYNSLNVAVPDNQAVSVGSDDNTDNVYLNSSYAGSYGDGGAAGVGVFRQDVNWAPNGTVALQVTAGVLNAPTNLHFQYKYDTSPLTNPYVNVLSKPNGNELELLWTAPAGKVTGYHIYRTFPDGTSSLGYQGPNTNAWTAPDQYGSQNQFGQHGEGAYTYQVVAVDAAGHEGVRSPVQTIYYDHTIPTATFTSAPVSYANGNFAVAGTAHDNVGLKSVFFDVRSQDGKTWEAGCVSTPVVAYSNGVTGMQDASLSCTINTSHLVDGTTYMLRIHASDNIGYGNVNNDAIRYFTYDVTPPVQPVLVSPSTPAIVKGSSITQSWSDSSSDVDHYIYQSFNDAAATSLRYTTTYTGTSKTAANVGSGTYWWRVIAVDHAGNPSQPSELWKITVDNTAPTSTNDLGTLLSGSQTVTQTVTDNVQAASGELKIWKLDSNNQPAGSTVFDSGVTPVDGSSQVVYTFNTNTNQFANGKYVATFTATDVAGNTSAPQSVDFTVDNITPLASSPNLGFSSPQTSGLTTTRTTTTTTTTNFAVAPSTNNAGVLGDSTTTPSSTGSTNSNNSGVKGDSTTKQVASATTDANKGKILGVAWYWWLILLAAIGLIWWIIAARRSLPSDEV